MAVKVAEWLYELVGYRALAINSAGRVQFRSRNDNDFAESRERIIRDTRATAGKICINFAAVPEASEKSRGAL
jgi:hypothetical protein